MMTDQNLQFARHPGRQEPRCPHRGRFVWERYGKNNVEKTKLAFDTVYSVTLAEQERYAGFGIETPYVRYGIHPIDHREHRPEAV